MGWAEGLGIASGAMSAIGSLAQAGQQKAQQRQQAQALERQATLREQAGRIEAETIDMQKSKLRREYEREMGANRVSLGAGNVDLSSGSANQVALGNIDRFADDVSENQYAKALKLWETQQSGNQYRAEASQLKAAADNWGPSLLTAGLGAASGFLSGYSLGGGKFFSEGAKAAAEPKFWDRALQQFVGSPVRH